MRVSGNFIMRDVEEEDPVRRVAIAQQRAEQLLRRPLEQDEEVHNAGVQSTAGALPCNWKMNCGEWRGRCRHLPSRCQWQFVERVWGAQACPS